MANDKRFVVKHGLQTQNIEFVSDDATKNISTIIDNSGTISFTGSNGNILSLSNTGNATVVGSVYGNNFYVGSWGQVIDTQGNWTGNKIATSWVVKTANYTAEVNDGIIADTTSSLFTITLPAFPTVGDIVSIADGADFENNNLTVNGNSSTIEDSSSDLILNVSNVRVDFIYDGTTWKVFANVGPIGYTGSQGDVGFTGSQGVIGYTGSQGDFGYTGSRGVIGYTGSQGDFGYTGSIGYTGSQGAGFTGSQGEIGFTGSKGDTGLGFSIAKTYSSVAALLADTAPIGILEGQFALIDTGDVNDPDNGKLYLWNGTAYSYITDLSGSTGIKGETGPAGDFGYTGSQGEIGFTGSQGIGFTGSKGDPGVGGTFEWVVKSANYTAVPGDAVLANTSLSTFTVTLPANPQSGDAVAVADAFDWEINNLTVQASGTDTIEYTLQSIVLDIKNVKVEFIYEGTTWQIYSSLGKIGFTGSQGAGFTGSQGAIGFTGSQGPGVPMNEVVAMSIALS